ncbi:MAG: ATP phosphoribosyltransferase regulatory subunit [Pseudomonadota bacterium]
MNAARASLSSACLSGEALERRSAVVERLLAVFTGAGHAQLEPPHLLDADLLLDLYGEDIRTRAFLFPEPVRSGELCLRPDFTLPVALSHAQFGWQRAASYAYAGPVFRLQDMAETRPIEYLQVGIERYGEADRARADAAVLALMLEGLDALGLEERRIMTGDPSVVFSLLDALPLAPDRRTALRRHFWRPNRFRALIERFSLAPTPPGDQRAALLEAAEVGAPAVEAMAAQGRELVGLRGLDEIAARAGALAATSGAPPMPGEEADLIGAVLDVRGGAGEVLAQLRDTTTAAGVNIGPALEAFERRLDALNCVGIDAEMLPFDVRFGRAMEYYDGFVFEITADGEAELPPLAGGGRYDSMTRRLGAPEAVPAVGAMIRPEVAIRAGARP